MATTSAKCAHPACGCTVPQGSPFGKYCSDHCRDAGKITELRCNCHHPECAAPARDYQSEPGERNP